MVEGFDDSDGRATIPSGPPPVAGDSAVSPPKLWVGDRDRPILQCSVRPERPLLMRSSPAATSSSPATRSLGVLLVVLFAGYASLVIAGHGGSASPREARTAAVWNLSNWPHAVVEGAIGCEAARRGATARAHGIGARSRIDSALDRNRGFGAEIASRSLSRRLNLPPPIC